ncbi:MAG: hypothetical protein U1E39_14940 [Planctomycetota bacterium]
MTTVSPTVSLAESSPRPSRARDARRGAGRASRAACLAGLAVVGACLVTGCGDDGPRGIDEVRDRAPERGSPALGVTAVERLGLVEPWTYDVPPTWTRVESGAPGRIATFRVGPGDDALEVALSSAGGTLAANVDRWRGQMGLPPEGEAGLGALPRKPFLGREGVLVDLRGPYGGMGGAGEKVVDGRLLGLILSLPGTQFVLKTAGAASAVDAEAERFFAFAASVRSRFVPPPAGTADAARAPARTNDEPAPRPAPAPTAAGTVTAGGYRFTVPAGWVAGPERPMRLATFYVGGAKDVEVTAHEFGAVADGVRINVNRWRSQFGLPDATPEEVDALPKLPMLGRSATAVELTGHLTDTMRGVELDDALLFGVIVERGDKLVFVKLTGPAARAKAARAAVEAFCRSMEVAP